LIEDTTFVMAGGTALSVMAGPDPAIHANTGLAEIAWMAASRADMTERRPGMDDGGGSGGQTEMV
jgi:hypothetical protein